MDASQHVPFHSAPPPTSFSYGQTGVGSAHARARPRPNKVGASGPRESNALRASVFDVAMELGITSNNLVADWMFNNAVQEEDEEASPSPGLAHHPSATASDDLHSSTSTSTFSSPRTPLTPSTSTTGPPNSYGIPTANGKLAPGWNPSNLTNDIDMSHIPHDPKPVAFPDFGDIPVPPRPTTPGGSFKKLKKKKSGLDGDESDGGYLSDGNAVRSRKQSTKDKKEEKARLKEEKREAKEAAKEAKEEEKRRKKGLVSGETKEEKEERKRKKSFGALSGKSGKKLPAEDTGYETDSLMGSTSRSPFRSKTKKSKSKPPSPSRDGLEYETDAGYASASSKKSKSRFFKLGSKSSKGDGRGDGHGKEVVPPMPDPPMLPMLPIASKFATSLGDVLSRTSSQEDSPVLDERSAGTVNGSAAALAGMSTTGTARPPVPLFSSTSSISDGGSKPPMLSSPPRHEPLSLDMPSTSSEFSSSSPFTPPTTTSTYTPNTTTPPLSTTAVQDRSSLSSAETHTTTSSMSSNSRRRGYQFSPPPSSRGMSMASHTTAPSVSTINSSVASMAPVLSHQSSSTTLNSTHALKPPSIFLPLTRSVSPSGGPVSPVSPPLIPIAPLQISKHPKLPSLDTGAPMARGASPMPHSPAPISPFVMVTASESEMARARAMSPLPSGSEPRLRPPRSPMPPHSPSAHSPPSAQLASPPMLSAAYAPLSPMSNASNGRSISPMPLTNGGRISPNPLSRRRISPLNLAQDTLQAREDGSMLPSPNVLAYYDIPPPSPPPVGPLPSVPPVPSAPLGAASQLRNKVMERQKEVPDLNGLGGVKRGKQNPFPTRPVVSPPPRQIFAGMYGSKKSGEVQEKRVRIISKPLDAFSNSGWEDEEEYNQEYQYSGEQAYGEDVYYEADQRGSGLAYDDDPRESYGYSEEHQGGYPADVGEEEMQEVLDRFADASVYGSSDDHGSSAGHGVEKGVIARGGLSDALRSAPGPSSFTPSHSHSDSHVLPPSFSQLAASTPSSTARAASPPTAKERDSFALSEYYSRDTMYGRDSEFFDDESIYSRVSVMDPDQSEEARERFVKRVQAMMKARGEEPEVIPPVPKIPEGLANTAAWNRF